MKVKKVLVLLLIPVFCDMLVACCDCGEPQLFRYTNKVLELEHLDNRGQSAVVVAGEPALKEAYSIRLTVKGETTAFKTPSFSFFINRSYAFSCGCDPAIQYLPKDSITAIYVITVNDFDAQHPAGTDISAYFRLYTWNNFTSIDDYLQKDAKIFSYDEPKQIILNALLMQPPASSGVYRFKIVMDLSDGRRFDKETSTIELL